jgi:hypothetical protein
LYANGTAGDTSPLGEVKIRLRILGEGFLR